MRIFVEPLGYAVAPTLFTLCAALGWLTSHRPVRAFLPDLAERLLVYALIGFVVASWLGTSLGAIGLFRWWAFALAVVGLTVAGHKLRPTVVPLPAPSRKGQAWRLVLSGALVLLAVWLYARPAESWLLTDDSAVYTIAGVTLARTGGFPVYTAQPWQVSAELMGALYQQSPSGLIVRHFGPFFQWTGSRTPLELGFLPLPKVWAAFVVWLFGPSYAVWAVPYLGVLTAMLMAAWIRRLSGWRVAAPATLALVISFPQVWFARYPISEIHAQAVLLGALYLLTLYRQQGAKPSSSHHLLVISALCLGLFAILRLEGLLYIAPVAVVIVLSSAFQWPRWGDGRLWLASLAGTTAVGLVLSLAIARFYIFDQTVGVATPSVTRYLIAFAFLLALLGAVGWRQARLHPLGLQAATRVGATWLVRLLGAVWIVWAILALYLIAMHDRGATVPGRLSLYWSRPGLALSVLGILGALWPWARRQPAPEMLALWGVGLLFVCLFTAFPLVNDVHPWTMRRLMPAVMPTLAYGLGLGCGAALDGLRRWSPQGATRQALRLLGVGSLGLVVAAQLVLIGSRTWPFLLYRDAEGLWQQLTQLDEQLPKDAVVLFDNGSVGRRLPQVMELVFGRPSLVVSQLVTGARIEQLDVMLRDTQARGRPAYLIVTDGDLGWRSSSFTPVYRGQHLLTAPGLSPVTNRNPLGSDIVMRSMPLDVYEIVAQESVHPDPSLTTFVLPLGPEGYPYLTEGFWWAEEDSAGRRLRWTKGDALITIPWPAETARDLADLCLSLTFVTGRPAGGDVPRLSVSAEGTPLLDIELNPGFGDQKVCVRAESIENRDAPELELRLKADTWSPQEAGLSQDSRELGILLSEMIMQPGQSCPAGCLIAP